MPYLSFDFSLPVSPTQFDEETKNADETDNLRRKWSIRKITGDNFIKFQTDIYLTLFFSGASTQKKKEKKEEQIARLVGLLFYTKNSLLLFFLNGCRISAQFF